MSHGANPIESSLDYPALVTLRTDWSKLQRARAAGEAEFVAGVEALAKRVVDHRAKLFDANARLLAEAPGDDDPASVAQTESNQDAIKACTTLLNEMTFALGRTSIPATVIDPADKP